MEGAHITGKYAYRVAISYLQKEAGWNKREKTIWWLTEEWHEQAMFNHLQRCKHEQTTDPKFKNFESPSVHKYKHT